LAPKAGFPRENGHAFCVRDYIFFKIEWVVQRLSTREKIIQGLGSWKYLDSRKFPAFRWASWFKSVVRTRIPDILTLPVGRRSSVMRCGHSLLSAGTAENIDSEVFGRIYYEWGNHSLLFCTFSLMVVGVLAWRFHESPACWRFRERVALPHGRAGVSMSLGGRWRKWSRERLGEEVIVCLTSWSHL
jgi:hypothetical protein